MYKYMAEVRYNVGMNTLSPDTRVEYRDAHN